MRWVEGRVILIFQRHYKHSLWVNNYHGGKYVKEIKNAHEIWNVSGTELNTFSILFNGVGVLKSINIFVAVYLNQIHI